MIVRLCGIMQECPFSKECEESGKECIGTCRKLDVYEEKLRDFAREYKQALKEAEEADYES